MLREVLMSRRYIVISLVVIVLLGVIAATGRGEEPTVHLFFFHSLDCSHCEAVTHEVLPPLLEEYGAQLQIRYFDISIPENYEALLTLEERYDLPEHGIPQIFLGEWALVGEAMIREHLDRLIAEGLEAGGADYLAPDLVPVASPTPELVPAAATTPTPTTLLPKDTRLPPEGCKWCDEERRSSAPIVYMAYFYDTACLACDRVSHDLNLLHSQYPNLYVRSFDISEHTALSEALGQRAGVAAEKRMVAPAVFVGDDYLVTPDINAKTLATLVDKYASSGTKPPWEIVAEEEAVAQSIIERFASFSALTVIGAGLVDGVNPCAFAGIIFFVSYLAVTKRQGKEILIVGATFTTGVFLSYLLIGLGILGFVRQLTFIRPFSRIVYMATMTLCAILALLSFHDYLQIRRGHKGSTALHLPKALQARLHKTIRERSRVQSFAWAAFVTGFLVSLLEFACTGQVYLPTIIFVTGVPELRTHAVAYLLLYNLLFVAPLVIIFLLTYLGTTWRQLNEVLESNMATLKLLTAGLFALLAVWLGFYIL
jgi:cytochrome c biogenesis protein CcdA